MTDEQIIVTWITFNVVVLFVVSRLIRGHMKRRKEQRHFGKSEAAGTAPKRDGADIPPSDKHMRAS